MIKLIIFDLDNTLAPPDKPIPAPVIKKILHYESQGIRIAIISGKPMDYLFGLSRQLGLQKLILSSENGAFISFDNDFPPHVEPRGTRKEKTMLHSLRSTLADTYGKKIRFQNNCLNLTVFPEDTGFLEKIYHTIVKILQKHDNHSFSVYIHNDAVEVIPNSVNKGLALKKIKLKERIKKDEVIAVGDSETDIPMQDEAIMIGIGIKNVDYEVRSLGEAIYTIEDILRTENRDF